MKKGLFAVLAAVMLMCFTACQEEREHGGSGDGSGSGGGSGSGKQVTAITMVEDGFVEAQALLEWNGATLQRATLNECGRSGLWDEVGTAEPVYNSRGLMESIVLRSSETGERAIIDLFYNSNQQVEEIVIPGEGSLELQYNGDGMIRRLTVDGESLNITWDGNNPTRLSDSDGASVRVNYGTLTFPLNDLLSLIGVTANMNCPTRIVPSDADDAITVSYQSAGGYPTVVTLGYDDDDEEVQLYFQYGDGSGATPPQPVARYYVYWYASPWDAGYVEDQDGYINDERRLAEGSTLTLTAVPYTGYSFSRWSDGNTQNPRTIAVTSDAEYCAEFVPDGSGGGGSTSGNSVTFNGYSWSNVNVLGSRFNYYEEEDVVVNLISEQSNFSNYTQYPWMLIQLDGVSTTGTKYLTADENGFLGGYNRIEYADETSFTDNNNNYYGDWWAKSATVNVSSYNFGTQTFSLTINATMFDVRAVLIDQTATVANAPTRQLSVTLSNVSWDYIQTSSSAPRGLTISRSLATPGRLTVHS